jgi:5'(3')-deoxyribonucleotidase
MAEARKKQRLFVDIDGTLAVFKPVDTLETLYEKGYFLNLAPHENVVAAVKEIVTNHPEIEVNILSAYLTDSQYALQEKNEWLDRYLPEIDQTHRIFVPCGSDKKEGIGGIRSDDFLLDDYTHNLNEWQPPARGIKLLNAINHTRGSWEHDRIRYDRTPTDLADGIISIMRDERRIFDEKINERERKENMAQERVTGVKPAPTELAGKIVNFLENYDPAFGYAEGMAGQENKEQWIDTITERLLQERTDSYIAYLRELAEQTPEAKEEADAIILEIMDYEGKLPSLNQFPFSEVSTLDFVNNPDRQGTGGLNRDSRMFEAMLLHTREQEQTELYRRYDEAFTAANLKDDFQPKIAILQLREGEENHNRRFISLETLDRIMHEQPNCENYELVYLRNAEVKAGTEQERERLNNQLYAEFNADTLRPRDYYGHSLSVGDVIVITNDFSEQHAYYVDDMGFTKLPDDFLSHEMSAKIRNDLDIRQEEMLYENIGKFEAESTMSIMDKTAADRYFQITSGYSRIFELADRRGAIMDMDALGYEPAQIDGFSDDFLMWKTKDEVDTDNSFGFDGWEAVRDFTNNVHTLINNYTVQELQDRANGNYSIIEYGTFDDREVQTAIKNYPQQERAGLDEYNHGEYENITLHIKYQEPINFNGFVVENDTITFGSQEELSKYVNGEAAYDVLDNSVMKRDNEILLYAENENGDVVWGTKEEQRETESMTYGGFDYTVIDKWQDDNASYVVGQLEADDGTWYAAKVTDTTEQYRGEYEYEFSTDKPTRSDVEDMHLNHISEIAIDRHEAEYGADGSRNFPNLNDPSPEEQAEELRQIVAEKSAPVEIDETLPPKDQLKQRLENGVRQVLDSEQFKNWLTTGGKLFYNNYSFRNAMLVWLQKPEASYVMGYEKWKDFGRNVKQGAQGAKIFIPLMASEKYKGGLFRSIKSNLTDQLSKDPSLTEASYRLGTSNLEFTMNRANHLIGFKVNGKEQQIFGSDDEAKRFIDRAIIGKVPTGFTVGTVFDAKDVIVPEYLWVKSGYTKEEIAPDEKGNPVKNRRGEVRIFNTPERQARFQTELDTRIVAKDPVKMQALFDACVAASERKGVPVSLAEKADDSTLDGGAKGYFSRQFTEDKPNGFIVIDNSLEITEKCAVLFHEMGHADLHKNLEALAKSMGEDKITREMREVQAEATAYAVASTFRIETDTSSFQYLAAYARGFELQDFQKSLDVIYRETQALTNDIKAELDIRGLNLDLTEKPKEMLNKETLETLSTKYMDFAAEQGSKVQAALNELPSLVKQSAGNPELMDVLKYQKANLDSRKADLDTMLTAIENLNTADTREKQDEIISTLDAAMNRVNGDAYAFENLSENYVVITERARGGLKVDFEQNPQKTLEAMKKDYPALAKLSEPQLQYLATSKFVAREFTKLLRDNPQEFVDKACERAALISKAASKNGTFVEVNFCEQWTDKPFFEKGTLCSPKIADKTVTGCEAQARGFSAEAEKRGDYFPYTKCDMTIFTPNKDGKLISLNTRVDIGDGAQTSLKDHLEQLCKRGSERKEVLANFTEALTERADKRKLLVQDLSAKPQSAEQPEMTTEKEGNMSREEWDGQIKDAREKAAQEQREKAAEKAQNKSNRDRAE